LLWLHGPTAQHLSDPARSSTYLTCAGGDTCSHSGSGPYFDAACSGGPQPRYLVSSDCFGSGERMLTACTPSTSILTATAPTPVESESTPQLRTTALTSVEPSPPHARWTTRMCTYLGNDLAPQTRRSRSRTRTACMSLQPIELRADQPTRGLMRRLRATPWLHRLVAWTSPAATTEPLSAGITEVGLYVPLKCSNGQGNA
jgi:hypothetical protein